MGLPWAARGGGCSATGGTEAGEAVERRDSAAGGLYIWSQGDSAAATEVTGPDTDIGAGAAAADGKFVPRFGVPGRSFGVADVISSRLMP